MKVRHYINKDYAALVGNITAMLAEGCIPSGCELIYSGRNSVYRLRLNGIEINIKAFRRPSFPNNYIYTRFRKSKARRSYEYAVAMLERGLPTPTPLAWIERKLNGRLIESYYVSEQSPFHRDLRQWQAWNPEERDTVLTAYVRLMSALHKKGIEHHDLSPGNVLWHIDGQTGTVNFHIIDLNRMTVRNRELTFAEAMKNFRNINLEEDETRRLGYLYGIETGRNPEETATVAVKALRNDLKRKNRNRRIKQLLKSNKTKNNDIEK